MMIISILELLPTLIATSPSTSLWLFCNSCFELLILATEQVSNTQGLQWTLARHTLITCISNIPLFTLPSFLSTKYSGHFCFQWPFPLQYKHSVSGFGPALGFFTGVTTCLSFYLKFPFFLFSLFLKLVVLSTMNTWCFSWFLPLSISASRRAWESFSPSLPYYGSSRSSSNLVMVTR